LCSFQCAACAFAIHLVELIIPSFSRLDISKPIHFFSSFLAMKLIAALLVALKIFTATAQEGDRPTCPDWMVTRDDCNTYCNGELAKFPGGSWEEGWMQAEGGIGNISGCSCTAWETWKGSLECDVIRVDGKIYCDPNRIPKNKRPGRQIDMSCSRVPTPPPPMPQPGRAFCELKGIKSPEDCQDYCAEYSRSPRAIMDADGMLRCQCLDGPGGNVDWYCDMRRTTPRYVRSG
jgi:hypothetical protein